VGAGDKAGGAIGREGQPEFSDWSRETPRYSLPREEGGKVRSGRTALYRRGEDGPTAKKSAGEEKSRELKEKFAKRMTPNPTSPSSEKGEDSQGQMNKPPARRKGASGWGSSSSGKCFPKVQKRSTPPSTQGGPRKKSGVEITNRERKTHLQREHHPN